MVRSPVFLVACLLLCACCPRQIPPEMAVFGPESDLIIKGRIRALHTSTIDSPDAESMGVVRVIDVIRSPSGLPEVQGRDISVKFGDVNSMSVGQELILFTTIAALGEEIAVIEIGTMPADRKYGSVENLAKDAIKAKEIGANQVLRDQVLRADVILYGTVARIVRVDRSKAGSRDSEHDPMWTEAVVQVREGMRGAVKDSVSFVFAASNDVAWYQFPKVRLGDQGVFLLRRDELVTDRLALLDRNGFQVDKESINKVREYVARSDHD